MRPMTSSGPALTWLREPLVHFLFAGGALLLLYEARAPGRRITVGPEERAALLADQARRGAGPTGAASAAAAQEIVDHYVDGEVLYREALARGLDRGDVIVRRRLIQKMEFLLEAEGDGEPTEAELADFLRANQARYARPERLGVEHVFVRAEGPGHQAAAARAEMLRARLVSGEAPAGLGDPFPRGASLPPEERGALAATFGEPFAAAVAALPAGEWSGPLRSPFGLHLVRVRERLPPRPAEPGEVREQLRADLRAARRSAARRDGLRRLKDRYDVRIAP